MHAWYVPDPDDVAETMYVMLSTQFEDRVRGVTDELDQLQEQLELNRKAQVEQDERRAHAMRKIVDVHRDTMETIARDVQERLRGIRKGKYAIRNDQGILTADAKRLSLPKYEIRRTMLPDAIPRVVNYVKHGDIETPAPSESTDEAFASAVHVNKVDHYFKPTVEDVSDEDDPRRLNDRSGRPEPPHLDVARHKNIQFSKGYTTEERLRRANLLDDDPAQAGAAPSISTHFGRAHYPEDGTSTTGTSEEDGLSDDSSVPYAHPAPPPIAPTRMATAAPTWASARMLPSASGHIGTVPASAPLWQHVPRTLQSAFGGPVPFQAPVHTTLPVDPYLERNLKDIADRIDNMVGQPRPGIPPKTNLRPNMPEDYDGRDSHELFHSLLSGITSYLRLSYLCGPDFDEDRLLHASNCVAGEAREWWTEEVLNPHFRNERRWTFRDAVCSMYARFVRQGSSTKASEDFDAVRFSKSKGGVDAFYNQLLKYAQRMIVYPDGYTLAKRFYNGLPADIAADITKIHRITAENSTIQQLLYAALPYEDYARQLEHKQRELDSARTSTATRRDRTSRTTAAHTSASKDNRQAGSTRAPLASVSSPPVASRGSTGRDGTAHYSAKPDSSRKQCYRCKQYGHISSDPACPDYQKPALRMMNPIIPDVDNDVASPSQDTTSSTAPEVTVAVIGTVDSDLQERAPSPSGDYAPEEDIFPDGSQYDSESDAVSYYDAPHSDHWESFRAMRTCPLTADDDMPDMETVSDSSESSFDWTDDEEEYEEYVAPPAPASTAAMAPSHASVLRRDIDLLERAARHDDAALPLLRQLCLNAADRERARSEPATTGGFSPSSWYNDLANVNADIRDRLAFDFGDDDGVTGPLDAFAALPPLADSVPNEACAPPLAVPEPLETLFAMAAAPPPRAYCTAMRTTGAAQARPNAPSRCLTVYVTINGLKALALIDTGSTINCVSPDFARVARLPVFELSNPIGLQLGCVGSRSKINFGTKLTLDLGGGRDEVYLDVVNIDHYDVILGIPYLLAASVQVDFAVFTLRSGNTTVPALQGEGVSHS